jgi:hypothetical protein
MNRRRHTKALPLFLALALCAAARIACAGNIDPSNQGQQYAWGENVGWINFKPADGPGVTVTDSAVTGFAWAENIGWINLSPSDGGVVNDGFGGLSGFAWGENVGWINFAPTGAGVRIDLNGHFFGFAWGENVGWINFNVPSGVETSFKPQFPAPMMNRWGILMSIVLMTAVAMYSLRRGSNVRGN